LQIRAIGLYHSFNNDGDFTFEIYKADDIIDYLLVVAQFQLQVYIIGNGKKYGKKYGKNQLKKHEKNNFNLFSFYNF
jgi:oxalate decarboxylase/phosphoglucose isomerase-like protein (cupin superfamily)